MSFCGDTWNFPFFVLEVVEEKSQQQKRTTIQEVPSDVLRKVRDKWQRILDRGRLERFDWSPCSMCDHLREKYDKPCDRRIDEDHGDFCPLWDQKWCRESRRQSRLGNNDDNGAWKSDVAEFVCWLNKELASRYD